MSPGLEEVRQELHTLSLFKYPQSLLVLISILFYHGVVTSFLAFKLGCHGGKDKAWLTVKPYLSNLAFGVFEGVSSTC